MMTLQEFQAQHNLKDYLKNYDGYIIYTMTYFETSWSLLYSKYYTMTINMDAVRTEAEYIENVQQMFISFFFDWIPQLNYHYIKTEQLKVGSYGSSNKNSSKMSPIINNAKTSQDINDLPIMTANVMDNVDYDSLYQNAFSNKIVEKFYEAALDLFVSYTSNISFENGYTPIPPTIEVYFKDILGNYFDNVNLNTKFTSVDSAITALFQNDTTLQASKQNKLIQGTNITIDQTTNIISATGGSAPATWGSITGTLNNQTDLNIALNAKANGNEVVKLTGDQTITGNKKIEKVTTNEIYYDGNGAIKPLTFINNTQLAGYVDFIQPYKTGFKNYTGFRMLRDENGLLILGASILIDNRNALRIISQIDDIWVMNTLSMQGNRIINLGLPTSDTDASNKKYVDDSIVNKANKSLDNIDALPQETTTTKAMFRDTDGKIKEAPISAGGEVKFKNGTDLNTIDYDTALASSTNIWSSFRTNVKFNAKADNNVVVKITDNQDISGVKNFKDATSFEKAVNVYTNPDKTNGLFLDSNAGKPRITFKIGNTSLKTIELSSTNDSFNFNIPIEVFGSSNDTTIIADGLITLGKNSNIVNLQPTRDTLNKIRLLNTTNNESFAYLSDIPSGIINVIQKYEASSLNWVATPRNAPTPQARKLSQIIDATLWADILANSDKYEFYFYPNAQKGTAQYTNNKPIICTLKKSGSYLFSTTWETFNIVGSNIDDKFRYELYLECNRTDGTLYFVYDKVSGNDFPNNITMLYFEVRRA